MRHIVAHFLFYYYFCAVNKGYPYYYIKMKKITFTLLAMLALFLNVNAQQFVSTEPSNRNAVLEEFTGRLCVYCPDGHVIANQIAANNPGRFWSVNIHSEGSNNFSTNTYPNLNTAKGNQIRAGFGASSFPSGVVNRSTASAVGRGNWTGMVNSQLTQPAECNVAGLVALNPSTRVATITVEVYYTANSTVDENFLTIAMLQDSILGSQTGMSSNPAQVIGNQYCHMHVLRDLINENVWGDAISPTTQGSLVTRQYTYTVPEMIGDPNGVEVDLDNIHFVAWVTERQQGATTRPILNACELRLTTMTDEPIYPITSAVEQVVAATCDLEKSFGFNITNIGTETLTSIRFNAQVEEVIEEFEWTGVLEPTANTKMEFSMEIPFGSHSGTLSIVEANGVPYESSMGFEAESQEWATVAVDGATTSLKLYIIQDQFGEQTTWNIINSAGEIIAEGGPYQHLIGSGATQPNVANIHDVPANECYLFRIFDSNGNGICCNYGNGYYYMKDAAGNVIFGGEGNGDFGEEAKQLFSITSDAAVQVVTEDPRVLGSNEAMFIGSITGDANELGFEYYKLVDHIVMEVEGALNGNVFTATVDDLEANTMYSVKAFAVVNGSKVYGEEIHFHTLTEGVSELESTLKVYPNPANKYLTVEGEITSMEVYNTVGQCMLNKQVKGNTQIDLSEFENGLYFLRVYNNGETAVRKFSVNR